VQRLPEGWSPIARSATETPFMTGLEHPAPSRTRYAGEEIVHSRWKHRGEVNPLVVGSNPTGPTSLSAVHSCKVRENGNPNAQWSAAGHGWDEAVIALFA
jgi:hypothetical protein